MKTLNVLRNVLIFGLSFVLLAAFDCSGSRRGRSAAQLLGQDTDTVLDVDTQPQDNAVISEALIKDQFPSSYKYGSAGGSKYFTPDKVNTFIDGKKVSIFVQKDSLGMRPMFVIKAKNNTNCESKYKAYIKKFVAFRSSIRLSVNTNLTGSYLNHISGVPSNISTYQVANVNIPIYGSETIKLISATDPVVQYSFSSNDAKLLVCIDQLISTSKHGVAKLGYKDELPVFFVELEMME